MDTTDLQSPLKESLQRNPSVGTPVSVEGDLFLTAAETKSSLARYTSHSTAPSTSTKTLDELEVGDSARVLHLCCSDRELRNKLLSMGLVGGAEIEVLSVAPLGDPMTISLLGFQLSLRLSEARSVSVTRYPR